MSTTTTKLLVVESQTRSEVVIYLRALLLRHGARMPESALVGTARKSLQWMNTVRSVIQQYRAILNVSTKFPKAGERNHTVEDYVEQCVAVWEVSGGVGEYGGWVLDAFDAVIACTASGITGGELEHEADMDQSWGEYSRVIMDDLREAETLIDKAKTRLNVSYRELSASVVLAEGIWLIVIAIKSLSYVRYIPSTSCPSSEDNYEDNYNQHSEVLCEQNLEKAILHVATAAESKPSQIRYWYLIGLLSATMEQWEAAQSALEKGAALGEVLDVAQNVQNLTDTQSTTRLSVPSQGTAKVNDHSPRAITQSLLPSSELLQVVADHPELSKHVKFEYVLQLRKTQVAMIDQDQLSLANISSTELQPATPIMISPAISDCRRYLANRQNPLDVKKKKRNEIESDNVSDSHLRISAHIHDRDASKSREMQQKLKSQVDKGSARISTISKKIGQGVVKNGSLRRFVYSPTSEILPSFVDPFSQTLSTSDSKWNRRTTKENRPPSDLWRMPTAIFRRLGKIEQAKGAIEEAEGRDESNPGVWVQLGLYYVALDRFLAVTEPFQEKAVPEDVDFVAGFLVHLTQDAGWDVAEPWNFLAKAYGMQGRKERERNCLTLVLKLSENRGVRSLGAALELGL
ncbi:uncharacterized protein C8R40DRAFT_1068936 [Lentinula edodes]|uniref:uncharacterized protein n=1 Tax=Lentinula edodes TaxID=5353 RepID=UPI001E8CA64D|nr:uncharacterized protein C8R40DRAFT_1068936 [Lentinula edodes]KAH7876154.1 hypothetical protein C8R40DRAFT_1068936 [Lentinula edodes]